MPFASEKILIAGTKFDRRIKLTKENKQDIIRLHKEESFTYAKLGLMFKVSRRTIDFICNPEKLVKNLERLKERGGWKQYYDLKLHTEQIREHRRYKQDLYITGALNNGQQSVNKIKRTAQ